MKMNQQRTRTGLFLLLGAFAFVAGCSEQSKAPAQPEQPAQQVIDLNAPNGGFQATGESPAFGDADLVASISDERDYKDPVGDDAFVREAQTEPGARLFVMTLLWGQLAGDGSQQGTLRDGTDYDWSGDVVANAGGIVLRSVVSFEAQDGDSILPRAERTRLAWVSHTGDGYDGVRLFLVFPPSSPLDRAATGDSLWLHLGSYSRAFAIDQMETIDEQAALDESGNQISIQAYRVDPTASHAGGFMRGRWAPMADGESAARFNGVWVGAHGGVTGVFQGIYGTNDQGQKVFFGKYIDADGNFLGILRGTWETRDAGNPGGQHPIAAGTFRGEWVNHQGDREGELAGRWRLPKNHFGFLEGRWCQGDCLGGL